MPEFGGVQADTRKLSIAERCAWVWEVTCLFSPRSNFASPARLPVVVLSSLLGSCHRRYSVTARPCLPILAALPCLPLHAMLHVAPFIYKGMPDLRGTNNLARLATGNKPHVGPLVIPHIPVGLE